MEWLRVLGLFGFFIGFNGQQTTLSPSESPSHLISASRVLRHGIPTRLSITILGDTPVLVVSEIFHTNTSLSKTQSLIPGGATEMQELPAVPASDMSYWRPYELVIKGYKDDKMIFSNTTFLRFSSTSSFNFIQTDKPNYKPGQVVRIRVVSIHPDGRPLDSPVDMVIKDPRGNMIRQWLAMDSVLGIVSKEFQLSHNPPLGYWTIMTTVNDATEEKHFRVTHYVLPNFKVSLDVPKIVLQDEPFSGTVNAHYMYGKPVSGYLNITYTHFFHGISVHYSEEHRIHGTADFTFALPEDKDYKRSPDYMYQYYEGYGGSEYIIITVSVIDDLTGLMYHSNASVSLAKCQYNLAFQGYPDLIKPSLNFSAEVKVSNYDDSPLSIEDQGKLLHLIVTQKRMSPWSWRHEDFDFMAPRLRNWTEDVVPSEIPVIEIIRPVPADGVVPFNIQLSSDVGTLNIEARFEDAHAGLQLYNTYSSPSKSYIQLHSNGDPEIGMPLQLTVLSNFPLMKFHYLVMARGQLVMAGTESSSSFSLIPEHSWAPEACVLVYCVRPDGEIINDALRVPVQLVLKNMVSLQWSQHTVRPGEEVNLEVSVSEPGSVVGILVVDKATRQPGADNDITKEKVLDELALYSMGGGSTEIQNMGDPFSVFMAANLMVLTDAALNQRMDWRPEFPGEVVAVNSDKGDPMYDDDPIVRQYFPETWLWMDADLGGFTDKTFPVTAPDSITSWVATAFVMSETLGLGIVNAPVELTVFQDFFISLNLPAYIIRGELLILEVNLFNHLDQDLEVMVTVAESESFEFVFPDSEGLSMASTHTVTVWSHNGTMVFFPIRPIALGEIPLSVKAISSYSSDAVYKTVLVKPEGIEQSFTQTLFLEVPPSESSISKEISFTFPPDVVLGSERLQLSAVGDLLGPSITGLESLIKMPHGCGEQNMINFAPNIYILRYLTAIEQDDAVTRERAISFMMEGYERELSYQRDDGSFSAFGESDLSGSTWLTAFVLRCFLQAKEFIFIDGLVLDLAAMWLADHQAPSGEFQEPGRVIHTELQGGLDGPVSLTAYVLIAFMYDEHYQSVYAHHVSLAQSFLETKVDEGISSDYSLCLVTYALALVGSGKATDAMNELLGRAVMEDGVPMWKGSSDVGLEESWQPRTSDIEMAGYVLLALKRLFWMEQGLPIMRWISQQRSHLGGYGSTQDTIIALQALSEYAVISASHLINLDITVDTDDLNTVATFTIDGTNYLLYQTQEIEAETDVHLQVTAEGKGFTLFQMTAFYNVHSEPFVRRRRDAEMHEAFDLYVQAFDMDIHYIHLVICMSLHEGQPLNMTGMAILEVGLLSGFVMPPEGLATSDLVRKVEIEQHKVIIYLDSVTPVEQCIHFPMVLEQLVAHTQDAVVTLYDYYEPRRKTVTTYNSWLRAEMNPCDLCGDYCEECEDYYYDDYYVSASLSTRCHACCPLALALFLLLFWAL